MRPLRKILLLSFFFLSESLLVRAQTFYADSLCLTFYKGTNFNSTLLITDSLTKDTIEFDKQFSRNGSVSILYENNKPKYRIVNKAYFDKAARKTRRAQRRYFNKLRFWQHFHIHRTTPYQEFNFSKTPEIKSRMIFENGRWKKCRGESIVPLYALYDTNMTKFHGDWRAKF